jgi:hypothetical protein
MKMMKEDLHILVDIIATNTSVKLSESHYSLGENLAENSFLLIVLPCSNVKRSNQLFDFLHTSR